MIFRYDNDQGETRFSETPCERKILQNLNSFINRWSKLPNSPLSEETMAEIEKLKKHIEKGCLSGIPPGFGTERNEQLHRLLNRSMITGATRISVELAVTILTVLFYYHSSRTSPGKHTARKIAFTAHQMCCQRFCKGHLCTNLMVFDAHQRSSLTAPLPPRSKAVKAVFTHL